MKILIVANGTIPVRLYGGTQRVVWGLGKELAKSGHRVSYLVAPDSSCDFAEILPFDATLPIHKQIPPDTEIIHFNVPTLGLEKLKTPYIITMHGNINSLHEFDQNTIFISADHAARYGSDCYVHNGLDWNEYTKPSMTATRRYFHFLGKAAWRIKNVRGAIDIIKRTKKEKVKILGGVRFNLNMGLRFTFTPRAQFYGMVGGKEKDKLLQHSKGLLTPVRWHEPFGLSVIESLFYGCPVFGTPYGALPEIVAKDVGFLSKNCDEIAQELLDIDHYSNRYCHDYAVENFNAAKMADSYVVKYEQVLAGEKLNARSPKLLKIQESKYLEWNS
ncbi:MAG: glycosyltransferase family 4 protein [Desulfocapsa sp.]|nr:MAG: glycosyltransferase family 4 protein [Desulfocapsa sp.]